MRHATLLSAIPNRCAAGSALVVSVKPTGDLGDSHQVGGSPDAAAKIADVQAVPLLLLGGGVPQFPDFKHARQVAITKFGCAWLAHTATLGAMATRRSFSSRPAVSEETVDIVQFIDFPDDGGHLLGEVGRVHAGLV